MNNTKETILIKKEKEGFSVFQNRKLLSFFELKENYQRSLELLKQLNDIKSVDGLPIYKSHIFHNLSTWSLQQQLIFDSIFIPYAKYECLIKFIFENNFQEIKIDNSAQEIAAFFQLAGIKFKHLKSLSGCFRRLILQNLIKIFAFFINILAFIKLNIFDINILLYTPDRFIKIFGCDFRFQLIYQYLFDKKIPFLEVFHATFGTVFFKNLFSRKRLAIYLDVFPFFPKKSIRLDFDYDLSSFELYNQKFFAGVIEKTNLMAINSLKRVKILHFLFNKGKIKTLLAMDDARYIGEIIFSCRLNKIKTIGFQHAQFSKYHVGWINYGIPRELSVGFDKFYVWNNYWKDVLLSYSTYYNEENVELGGVLKTMKSIECKKILTNEIKIIIPFESGTRGSEIRYYLKKIIDMGIKVYFKVRPDVSVQFQLSKYGISENQEVRIIKDLNEEVLKDIDAIAGVCTTLLNEMIFYDKPIFVFKTSMDLGHLLIDDNLAVLLDKDFKLGEIIDYVKNYKSKKEIAWPKTEITLEKTLDKIFKN